MYFLVHMSGAESNFKYTFEKSIYSEICFYKYWYRTSMQRFAINTKHKYEYVETNYVEVLLHLNVPYRK